MIDDDLVTRRLRALLADSAPTLDPDTVHDRVSALLPERTRYTRLAEAHGSPLYVVDPATLSARARDLRSTFTEYLPGVQCFFAMKSNNHPAVASTLVAEGFGIDASSGLELEAALATDAPGILFSGPGKTNDELALAVEHAGRVTVLMDSFGELARLAAVAGARTCRAGVRLTTDERGLWRKFGIPPGELRRFLDEATGYPQVEVRGLQFHTSWNRTPDAQVEFLARVGETLAGLGRSHPGWPEFLDIGGGYWPARGEWLHGHATPEGALLEILGEAPPRGGDRRCLPSTPLTGFASALAAALEEHVFPWAQPQVYVEPGRWLVDDAMHILMTVVDLKGDDLVIVDAGTNAVGWERFETDYVPLINLSRPALSERRCLVLGSLCTPHDVWGYSYFGEGIAPGDLLMVPDQGAYTYSLRQDFIKPLPQVVMAETGSVRR